MSTSNIKRRVRLLEPTNAGRKKKHDDLTPKQKRFCEAYVIDMNGTKAAIAAGFSRKNARSAASTFLTKPNIQREVQKHQAKLAAKTEVNAQRVIGKLAEIAFGPTDPSLPKPADQLNALAQLGKHLGLFVERHEVDSRMTTLSVNVSAADLASARALVENFRSSERPMIEGEVSRPTSGRSPPDDEPADEDEDDASK